MRIFLAALAICFTWPVLAGEPESVFYGRALSHEYIEDVEVDCPEDHICMNVWFRWSIRVDNLLSGPGLNRRITAAILQHTEYIPKYEKSLRVFAVKPIEDEEMRQLLRADYYLLQLSPAYTMFCFNQQSPSSIGFDVPRVYQQTTGDHPRFCFELPEGSSQ